MLNSKSQKLCAWSGIVAVMLFFSALVCSGFMPVPSPSLTQAEVVAMYQQNAGAIRIGMVQLMISGMFMSPFVAVISLHLRRIEKGSLLWTYTQLSSGTVGILLFIIPGVLFLVTAYRPDRSPELTYLMNDICWFLAIMPWPPAFMQNIAIGSAIISDKSPNPIFPRWVGFFNFWVAILFLPGTLIPFFKSGPFTWNGLFGFWLPAAVFGLWFMVMLPMLLKAIDRQAQEATAT